MSLKKTLGIVGISALGLLGSPNTGYAQKTEQVQDSLLGNLHTEKAGERDLMFYTELARKIRAYGIDAIKDDIKKSDKIFMYSENITIPGYSEARATINVGYSSFSTEVQGEIYTINFVDDSQREAEGWCDDNNTKEIFINIQACEEGIKHMSDLATLYNIPNKSDVYDYISGVVAHEQYHKDNNVLIEEEEPAADAKLLNINGEPYLLGRLTTSYEEIMYEDMYDRIGMPRKFGNYGEHTQMYKNYTQALKNIIKISGKEAEFESAKNLILERWKTGWIWKESGEKEKIYVEENGVKIRKSYYHDEDGKRKEADYRTDLHKAFAKIITPDMLRQIIKEYKRLSQ